MIFSSVNLRNIVTDKVNVVIFTCDVDVCIMHKKLVKFGYAVFELCKRTDRQVNRHTHHNTPHPYGSTAHHVYSSAAMEHDKHIVSLPVVLDYSIW